MKIIRDDSSYSNELEKMAKFNKKHQKGWGWFVNPKASINIKTDAGNVPLNNAIFNSSMGQGTSDGACSNVAVAEDLLQDKIIELDNGVEIHLTPKIVEGSSFILPDGLFVDLEGDTHGGFDYWCAKENVKNPFENKRNIKVNDATNEYDNMPYPYIEIQDKPTQAQYNSILEWLDHLVRLGKEEVQFKNKSYSLQDNIPEDIIKNIKRYFASGVLYEGNGDKLTPKTPRQFIETNLFMKKWKELGLTDEDLRKLQNDIQTQPPEADLGKGLFKFRFSPSNSNKGQSGSNRVIYLDIIASETNVLLYVFAKNEKSDLTPEQKIILKTQADELKKEYNK